MPCLEKSKQNIFLDEITINTTKCWPQREKLIWRESTSFLRPVFVLWWKMSSWQGTTVWWIIIWVGYHVPMCHDTNRNWQGNYNILNVHSIINKSSPLQIITKVFLSIFIKLYEKLLKCEQEFLLGFFS